MARHSQRNTGSSVPADERKEPDLFDFDFTPQPKRPTRLLTPDELYHGMSSQLAAEADEDPRVERKPSGFAARALGDYFSMWANTAPSGGVILVGVEDKGSISGCLKASTSHVNDLERAGDVYCPDARYESKRVEAINADGKPDYFIVIRVYYRPDRVVETSSKQAFIRRGSSKKLLSDEEKRELR